MNLNTVDLGLALSAYMLERSFCHGILPGLILSLSCSEPLSAGQVPGARIPLDSAQRTFDIRDYRKAGDDPALDTGAINRAVEACSSAGGGQVLIPPGR